MKGLSFTWGKTMDSIKSSLMYLYKKIKIKKIFFKKKENSLM
jgi:hypothetical protein